MIPCHFLLFIKVKEVYGGEGKIKIKKKNKVRERKNNSTPLTLNWFNFGRIRGITNLSYSFT